MEQLDINNGNGQSYGYIVYRKTLVLQAGMKLKIRGHPRDLVQMMINGVMVNEGVYNLADLGRNFGSYGLRDAEFEFTEEHVEGCEGGCTLDLMVENLGRANFGAPHNFQQLKGLWEGDVLLDEAPLDDWEHIALEMTPGWLSSLTSWQVNEKCFSLLVKNSSQLPLSALRGLGAETGGAPTVEGQPQHRGGASGEWTLCRHLL